MGVIELRLIIVIIHSVSGVAPFDTVSCGVSGNWRCRTFHREINVMEHQKFTCLGSESVMHLNKILRSIKPDNL